jgi:formylglycine-generating enzyme required for sulfatase activity
MQGKMPRENEIHTGSLQPQPAPESPTPVVKTPVMIRIPSGMFIMGISDDQIRTMISREEWATEWYDQDLFQVEQPQHRLFSPAYEIGRAPVTNLEYHAFVWDIGHRAPKGWIGFSIPDRKDNHPVVGVSRKDALAYCAWLNERLNQNYRLPSEAEWERAARGPDGRLYPWGDDFDPWRCNTARSGKRDTTPVGEYTPSGDSPFGCVDMAGNVWEWTASMLKPYPYDATDGREGEDNAARYVIRGGAWYYSHRLARTTCREGAFAHTLSPSLGFRLARTIN